MTAPRILRKVVTACTAFAGLSALVSSCSRQTITVQLHPLQASGDVTYVCRDPKDGTGRPLSECNAAAIDRGEVDLYALVTQVATGEVAVINVPMNPASPLSGEGIVDVDPSVPGYGFLHVGALPNRIVSTPGGSVSFVGVGEAGKPGIFALPTACVGAPAKGETDRDLTSWPACSLPVAPGAMAVVVAPETDASCNTSQDRDALDAAKDECAAGLASGNEAGPPGRRKVVVSLPDRGSIAIIDAAWIARGKAGEFAPCLIEAELPLSAALPANAPAQVVPADLAMPQGCGDFGNPQLTGPFHARPAGVAIDKSTLYVADSDAPVVHVVDLSNPCAPAEKDPLLTRSFENPTRVVTTSRVAVSPLTPSGRQFVYAIDQYDSPTASVMAFDVSPGATDRTPIVRANTPLIPYETADRIQFSAAPRDITFIERDRPVVDPATGNVVEGLACDPTPGNSGVGTLYRSAQDYSSGARSVELRGVFGAALLTNGQVAIIDVEDFDAPCRRPVYTNTDPTQEDFRGCKGDAPLTSTTGLFVDAAGQRTVTDEVSCRMVEPHRTRAASLGITDSTRGIHAPSLRGFPQLKLPDSALQLSNDEKPKLLGVDFALRADAATATSTAPAQVFVGTALYGSQATDNPLDIHPATAQRSSVVLPFNEPRSYPATDTLTLTYEGALTETLPSGFLRKGDKQPWGGDLLTLNDPSVGYCDRGVHDEELMAELGAERFGLTGDALTTFAKDHADYVVLTGKFPDADDAYWKGVDATCGRDACIQTFGDYDPKTPAKEPNATREFHIKDAIHQWLQLEPRAGADDGLVQKALCCFPSGSAYEIRASKQWVLRGTNSGLRHKVIAAWEKLNGADQLNCVVDRCNQRKRYFESRVFEVCASDKDTACLDERCVAAADQGIVATDSAVACISTSSMARFAVYRGKSESVRNMAFSWQTIGGFSSMRLDFSVLSAQVSPNSLVGLPELNWLSVVDGASLGLVMLDLDTLVPLAPPLN